MLLERSFHKQKMLNGMIIMEEFLLQKDNFKSSFFKTGAVFLEVYFV